MTLIPPATLSDVLNRIRTRCIDEKRALVVLVDARAAKRTHLLEPLIAGVGAVPEHGQKVWTLEKIGSRETICQAGATGESEPVFYLP